MIIVDRFEGNIAVLETDNGMVEVEKSLLADDICEGDVLELIDGRYVKDLNATEERRQKLIDLRNKLLRGDKK